MPPRSPWTAARRHLTRRDPVLARIISAVGPCTLRPGGDPFTLLVRAIVSQMISTTAAERVFARLADLVEQVTPDRIRLLGAESLLGAGLSAAKARAIVALADASSDGRLPLHALDDWGDDELTEALTALPGIGPWTADMFLLFGLGRADILPVGDYGLRSGVQSHWGMSELPGKAELRALAEPWRPFRGIATWYIWRSKGAVPQS